MSAIENGKCKIPRTACKWCRNHPGENGFPSDCPHGFTKERLPVLLGDAVAKIATPIARALGLGCVDKLTGKLKPSSPCAKRQARWNSLG